MYKVIHFVKELDNLPYDSVVVDKEDHAWQKVPMPFSPGEVWMCIGVPADFGLQIKDYLPAKVVYEGAEHDW